MHIVDEEVRKNIGRRIEELRTSKGLSQEQLAEMAGVTASNVLRLEQGRYNASIELISQVVKPMGGRIEIVW